MNSEQLRQHYSNKARENTFNSLSVHERESHQGNPCLSNRIGFIAWLCHCIGIKPENLATVGTILEIYNQDCQDKTCGHNGLDAGIIGEVED